MLRTGPLRPTGSPPIGKPGPTQPRPRFRYRQRLHHPQRFQHPQRCCHARRPQPQRPHLQRLREPRRPRPPWPVKKKRRTVRRRAESHHDRRIRNYSYPLHQSKCSRRIPRDVGEFTSMGRSSVQTVAGRPGAKFGPRQVRTSLPEARRPEPFCGLWAGPAWSSCGSTAARSDACRSLSHWISSRSPRLMPAAQR